MINEMIEGRIQFPGYTAAKLAAVNPVLLAREVVYESDTRKRKVGDGVTAWNNLPYEIGEAAGGGSIQIIEIGDGDSISKIADYIDRSAKDGEMKLVFIGNPSGVTGIPDELTSSVNTLTGFVQQVYSVSDEYTYLVTLYPYANGNELTGRYCQILIDVNGSILNSAVLGGSASEDSPIPGYKRIYESSAPELSLISGSLYQIHFSETVPASEMFPSKCRLFIDGVITIGTGSSFQEVLTVPITIIHPNPNGGTVFEYMAQTLSTGTNIARIKLLVTSWIRESGGSGGVTGCMLMAQTNALGNSSYMMVIRGVYIKKIF